MATTSQLQRLQTLIWVLIFGGLMGAVYGLALWRYAPHAALGFMVGGAAVALVGAVLILVRARLRNDNSSTS